MSLPRSERRVLPAWAVPLVVLAGVVSMSVALPVALSAGLRLGLLSAELALAMPSLVALALFRVPVFEGLGLRPPAPARVAALAVLAGGAFWIASLGLMECQSWLWPPPDGFVQLFQKLHDALRPKGLLDALASVAAIALAPAVCEEIVFRGMALPALVKPMGRVGAVIGSAVLFGLIHLDTVGQTVSLYRLPFALAVGLGLGALRLLTGGLWSSIAAHATLNTITFAAVPLASPLEAEAHPDPILGAGLLLVGLVASLLLLRALSRSLRETPDTP